MPKKRKPQYQLHRASGQARRRIGGKDHDLGEYGTQESCDRYDDLIAEWFTRSGDMMRYRLRIYDLTLLYLEHAGKHYRKTGNRHLRFTESGLLSGI